MERFRLDGDGLVRIRQNQQRERNLVPHFARFNLRIDMPERRKPDAFLGAELRMVVVVIAAQHAFDAQLMGELEYGSVFGEVEYGFFTRTPVVGAFARSETQLCPDFGCCEVFYVE